MTEILYFGIPIGALALADAGHPPHVAILGPLDMPGRRRLRRLLPQTLLLGQPDLSDPSVVEAVRSAEPSRILSYFFPRKIPPELLALAPALGTHPSLLPRWRGPDPYFWTIRSGDTRTGVTLHRLDAEYDTGAVVETRSLAISPEDDAWSLARKLDRLALPLILSAATRADIEGVAQSGVVTHAPSPTAEDLTIDWSTGADDVQRLVRAAAPSGAYATFGETDVSITRARVIDVQPKALRAGEAYESDAGWAVRCGEDALLLERVEVDGRSIEPGSLLSRRA